MPTDIKLSKAQVSKIIQSGESFSSWLDNLGKKAPANFAIPWATENLRGLVSNLTANAIKSLEKKKKKKVENELWEQEKDLLYLFSMKIRMILLKL